MKTFLKSILTILVFISTLHPAQDGLIPIHRYFSKEDKDHFYTKKTDVKKKWKSQGIEFYAYANPVEGTVPIYRYYDKEDKDHFYTKKADVKKKWKSQGIEFYAYANPVEGTVPIYRYYDKDDKDHYYTKKADVAKKWKSQGIEFYAYTSLEAYELFLMKQEERRLKEEEAA